MKFSPALNQQAYASRKRSAHFVNPKLRTYLGHIISADGLKPSPNKLRAVSELLSPSKVSELKTFLGLVNYYAKFLPDLATRLALLYKLLKHEEPWKWTTQQETAFQDVKKSLLTPQILATLMTQNQ